VVQPATTTNDASVSQDVKRVMLIKRMWPTECRPDHYGLTLWFVFIMKWFNVLSMQMFNELSGLPAPVGTAAGQENEL
jgi:hypothetical protein